MINIIVATDPNGVIGKDNKLCWNVPEDLKLFKKRTLNSSIIMGRLTWNSLPKKPLPNRTNYIISRDHQEPEGIWCKSLEEAIEKAKGTEINVIGGEQIYKLALPLADRIILSKIHKEYEGNKYFNIPWDWVEYDRENYDEFDVIYYRRSRLVGYGDGLTVLSKEETNKIKNV